jgi:hypothetical protein
MWPDRRYGPFVYSVQVLTGDIPFARLHPAEAIFKVVVGGERPTKPKNASAIGLFDSLWIFVQRCWDGDMNARPKVTEVVAHLEEATANWDGLMPPGVLSEIEDVAEDPMSDSMEHCEFGVLVALDISQSIDGTGGIFPWSSSVAPESPTGSTEHREFEILAPL